MQRFVNHPLRQHISGLLAGVVLLAANTAYAGQGMRLVDLNLSNDGVALHGPATGADHEAIASPMLRDGFGNLYGTTASGGAYDKGSVYRVAPDGTKTVLYSFSGGSHDGEKPVGDLVLGKNGELYGTTGAGGASGCGTVFAISPMGEERIVHAFTQAEGVPALGVLHADETGNLYGATRGEREALFRLTPEGTLTILFHFA